MRFVFLIFCLLGFLHNLHAEPLLAGVGKVNITREGNDAGSSPLWAKALVLSRGETNVVLVSIDAVAIAEIGSIKDPYLANVRSALATEPGLDPRSIIINASHCHGIVAPDVEARTIRAVREAWKNRVPVRVGSGSGHEDRIMQNRRLILHSGKEVDVRHAYALPPNKEVASVGPIDPEIGILKLDRIDSGKTLAVVYQFACHPIQGVPGGGNTADLSGFASNVIEENLGDGNAMALFFQGCGGDINPAYYKTADHPRDAETLGTMLGLRTLAGIRKIQTKEGTPLSFRNEVLQVPRAELSGRIEGMEKEIDQLTASFRGTTLDFEKFLPLYVKYHLNSEFPAAESHRYLQDELLKKNDWKTLDKNNRAAMDSYLLNIRRMEELTRKQINLALLKKHDARNQAGGKTVDAEVVGLRVGDFFLVTFPAEVTVQIGLNIKAASPHKSTFVSGYTNGYLYYAPTAQQMKNRGGAQEDSDCLLAPEWQAMFEKKAAEFLTALGEE